MPIYLFECSDCGHVMEKILPITTTKQSIRCTECRGKAYRIISNTSFRLMGRGWSDDNYETKSPNDPGGSSTVKKPL